MTLTGALLPLDAPLPQPRSYTLLDAAKSITPPDDRWLAGGSIGGYPPGPTFSFDPCGTGTYRIKEAGGAVPNPHVGTFTVYLPGVCSALSIGSAPDWYKPRLQAAFEAVEATTVEKVLATGDGQALLGPYLTDGNLEMLNGGTAVDPVEALSLLEAEIATVGNGMIHVTPATATYWVASLLISPDRQGQMRTGIGTLVAVEAGLAHAYPDDAPGTPPDGEEWAYASGFVQYRRSEITILPGNYSEALDRSINEVVFIAERQYLLSWVGRQDGSDEANIQAGVLVALGDCPCT